MQSSACGAEVAPGLGLVLLVSFRETNAQPAYQWLVPRFREEPSVNGSNSAFLRDVFYKSI